MDIIGFEVPSSLIKKETYEVSGIKVGSMHIIKHRHVWKFLKSEGSKSELRIVQLEILKISSDFNNWFDLSNEATEEIHTLSLVKQLKCPKNTILFLHFLPLPFCRATSSY